MNATKTTERKTRPYDLVLLAVVVLILVVVFFQGAWYMPPSGPVRGKARLLDEGSPSSSTLTLERGWDLTHLAERHYGRVSPTILDMVLEANPSIRDINKIPVNQKIIMPPLSEASFVLPAPDNRYTIHLGTFDHIPALGDFRDDYALKGKTVEIMVRKISPREKWYRLVAGPFATREEIRETLSSLQSRGISFEFSPQGGSRESAAKNGDGP